MFNIINLLDVVVVDMGADDLIRLPAQVQALDIFVDKASIAKHRVVIVVLVDLELHRLVDMALGFDRLAGMVIVHVMYLTKNKTIINNKLFT